MSPLLLSLALAGVSTSGQGWSLDYGECGTWESGTVEDPYSGSAAYGTVYLFGSWGQVTVEYEDLDGNELFFGANDSAGSCDWTVYSEASEGSAGLHRFHAGELRIARYEVAMDEWQSTGATGSCWIRAWRSWSSTRS